MTLRFFSDKNRPIHLGPYPLERLTRHAGLAALTDVPTFEPLSFNRPDQPTSIVNAMRDHQAMLDAICDGLINKTRADCPKDPEERAKHIKSFGYFSDASMVGICALPSDSILDKAHRNPDIDRLAEEMRGKQTKSMASGIESIMADLKDTLGAPPATIDPHTHAIVFVYEHPRAPASAEPGTDWIIDAQDHRSCLLAAETAAVIANYLRLLGFDACGHTGTSSHVDLNKLAVTAGLAVVEEGKVVAPFLGTGFGISAITTSFEMTPDTQLVPFADQPDPTRTLSWKLGRGASKGALNHIPFAKRRFVDGPHPFETLKRVDDPTTYIDEARIPRVPKRADMFNRATFGDMGKKLQDGAKGGHYVRKAATSLAQRRALGALALLQDGDSAPEQDQIDPPTAAELVKATSYFLGVDAVGISRCPEWTWYSHDTAGEPIVPPHDHPMIRRFR